MKDVCNNCGAPCANWVSESARLSKQHRGHPTHCLIVALIQSTDRINRVFGSKVALKYATQVVNILQVGLAKVFSSKDPQVSRGESDPELN